MVGDESNSVVYYAACQLWIQTHSSVTSQLFRYIIWEVFKSWAFIAHGNVGEMSASVQQGTALNNFSGTKFDLRSFGDEGEPHYPAACRPPMHWTTNHIPFLYNKVTFKLHQLLTRNVRLNKEYAHQTVELVKSCLSLHAVTPDMSEGYTGRLIRTRPPSFLLFHIWKHYITAQSLDRSRRSCRNRSQSRAEEGQAGRG